MKGWKRFAGCLLAVCLLATGLCFPAAAAADDEMLQALALLNVMNGDEHGNLNLEKQVTRAEFAKMCIAASVLHDRGKYPTGISPFSDVPAGHWAAGYITAARDAGWLVGDLDGRFRPGDGITLAEAVTVALRMLGYTEGDFTGQWPSGQMALYRAKDLDKGITASADQLLTRQACARLVYNLLSTEMKSGSAYCVTLGYTLDADGNIDVLSLMSEKLDGPLVVSGTGWTAEIGFTPTRVYLNGKDAALSDIAAYHVLYYQRETSTVFAYSARHSGTITAIAPDTDAPASVTVGGVTYQLGTSQAAVSLSAQGQFRVGDRVTLLMGRGDKVAAVIAGDLLSQVVYGVVTAFGQTAYSNADGSQYFVDYVDVLTTDGQMYRYETGGGSYEAGDLVRADYSNERRTVTRLSEKSISGTVSGNSIGDRSFASDVEILDVWESSAVTVPVSRLAGCRLSSSDVRFVSYDEKGDVDRLILDDYTGDIHSYGVLVSSARVPTGSMSFLSKYTCMIAGTETVIALENIAFSGTAGGVQLRYAGGMVDDIRSLQSFRVDEAGEDWVRTASQRYTLDDDVQVYVKRDSSYYWTDWALTNDLSAYSLTAYYDKTDAEGGQVRVIIATAR